MNTLTQIKTQPQQLDRKNVVIEGASFEVDLHLTDWEAVSSSQPTVTMLAVLYSTDLDPDEPKPVPAWSGLVACTVAEPTEAAVIELIRSRKLIAENYSIGQIWQPELAEVF